MSLVVVSGAIANKLYQGGEAWVRLSYVLGLRRLGYRVHFIEQISRDSCVDAAGQPCEFESSANLAYFNSIVSEFGLTDCATLIPVDHDGQARIDSRLTDIADATEALLNISGHLSIETLFGRMRNRLLVDIDPGYTQYWQAQGLAGARVARHDRFFTIGENVGTDFCPIPTCGLVWWPTRPPVVLEQWPDSRSQCLLRFTTIANWRSSTRFPKTTRHGAKDLRSGQMSPSPSRSSRVTISRICRRISAFTICASQRHDSPKHD